MDFYLVTLGPLYLNWSWEYWFIVSCRKQENFEEKSFG